MALIKVLRSGSTIILINAKHDPQIKERGNSLSDGVICSLHHRSVSVSSPQKGHLVRRFGGGKCKPRYERPTEFSAVQIIKRPIRLLVAGQIQKD
jgi:hypothetical protein